LLRGAAKHAVPVKLGNEAIKGFAACSMEGKRLYLTWIYSVAGLTEGPYFNPNKMSSVQEIPVAFWPTDVTAFGADRIAVAGTSARGRVIVQILEFQPIPVPSAYYNMNGELKVPQLEVPLESITTALDADVEEKGDISFLIANAGASDQLLVQFAGVGGYDLHYLNTETGELSLAVTAGPAKAPALSVPQWRGYLDVQSGTHQDLGHLYWFYNPDAPSDGLIMLRDETRDGILDTGEFFEPGVWPDAYGDANSYDEEFIGR
jgi:hypothetical protein